jgi:hypothetical protein
MFSALFEWFQSVITQYENWMLGKVADLVVWALGSLGLDDRLANPGYGDDGPGSIIHNIMYDISWFIPVWSCLAIYINAVGVCGAVRFGRWVKSFIPSISG